MIWEEHTYMVWNHAEREWQREARIECCVCGHDLPLGGEVSHCPDCGEPNEDWLLGKDRP